MVAGKAGRCESSWSALLEVEGKLGKGNGLVEVDGILDEVTNPVEVEGKFGGIGEDVGIVGVWAAKRPAIACNDVSMLVRVVAKRCCCCSIICCIRAIGSCGTDGAVSAACETDVVGSAAVEASCSRSLAGGREGRVDRRVDLLFWFTFPIPETIKE